MENNNFKTQNIDDSILEALKNLNYIVPTKVQEKVIPAILQGSDIIVKSQTGSGKTAAFAIPLCQKVQVEEKNPLVLVLVPTRELAVQVKEEIMNIGRYKKVRCSAIFGKMPISIQTNELKQRVHFISGTPGRTLDHIERGNINTEKIKYLVIDEADEMLSMGFIDQIEGIIKTLQQDRITMVFSATMPLEIQELCNKYMINPLMIEINPEKLTAPKIVQSFYEVDENTKFSSMRRILYVLNPDSCIIFCRTKENVDKVYTLMKDSGFPCITIHGGMLQKDRLEVMKSFKSGSCRFLIATDVAARGIDIEDLSHVINFDVPLEKESYVHRIGRTGRVEKKGTALTLVTPKERNLWNKILEYIEIDIPKNNVPTHEEAEIHVKNFNEKNVKKIITKPKKDSSLNKGIMKIYISAGKDKKIRASDIVGAITSIDEVTGEDIGIIDIQDRFSHVEIMNSKGNLVIERLKNGKIKGKSIKVEKSNK